MRSVGDDQPAGFRAVRHVATALAVPQVHVAVPLAPAPNRTYWTISSSRTVPPKRHRLERPSAHRTHHSADAPKSHTNASASSRTRTRDCANDSPGLTEHYRPRT